MWPRAGQLFGKLTLAQIQQFPLPLLASEIDPYTSNLSFNQASERETSDP